MTGIPAAPTPAGRLPVPALGALVPYGVPVPTGLDVLVVDPRDLLAAHRTGARVLVVVTDPADIQAALAGGASGVVLAQEDPSGALAEAARRVDGSFVVLALPAAGADAGRDGVLGADVPLVRSTQAARAALDTGFPLVCYDLGGMVDNLVATLPEGRPTLPASDAGAGRPPLVMLSGMLGDATLWNAVSAQLDDLVVPWPERIDLDDSVAEMAASVLAAAPLRFLLVGHSLGGIVAFEVLRQQPARVLGLVLLNTSARGPSQVQRDTWARWRDETKAGGFRTVADALAVATLAATRRDDADLIAANAAMAGTVGEGGFLRQLAAQSTRPDSLATLADITVPVLVVSGDADDVCPPGLQQEIVENCRAARLAVTAGGHMLPLEAPDELAAIMRRWLVDTGLTVDPPSVAQ